MSPLAVCILKQRLELLPKKFGNKKMGEFFPYLPDFIFKKYLLSPFRIEF